MERSLHGVILYMTDHLTVSWNENFLEGNFSAILHDRLN